MAKTTALQFTKSRKLNTANLYAAAYDRFGLKIKVKKTKALLQPAPNQNPPALNVQVNGENIEIMKSSPYRRSIVSKDATTEKDIENRIRHAHISFSRLNSSVFKITI